MRLLKLCVLVWSTKKYESMLDLFCNCMHYSNSTPIVAAFVAQIIPFFPFSLSRCVHLCFRESQISKIVNKPASSSRSNRRSRDNELCVRAKNTIVGRCNAHYMLALKYTSHHGSAAASLSAFSTLVHSVIYFLCNLRILRNKHARRRRRRRLINGILVIFFAAAADIRGKCGAHQTIWFTSISVALRRKWHRWIYRIEKSVENFR